MPPPKKEPKQLVYSAIEMRELLGIGLKSVGVNFRARPGEMLVYNDGWTVEQLLRCKAGNMYISGTVPDELLGEHVEPGFCRLPFFKAGAQGFDRPYMYMEYGGSLHITCPLPVIFAALLAHYRATRQDFLGGNWCYCRETMWCFDHRQRVRIRMNSAGRIEIGSFGLAT